MKFSHASLVACLIAAFAFSGIAAAKDKHVAAPKPSNVSENATDTSKGPSDFDLLLVERKAAGAEDTPELRNALHELLVDRDLLVAEARKANLDKLPAVQIRIHMAEKAVLARQYEAAYAAEHPPTEGQLKAAYETVKQRAGETEYHVRQIYVAQEEEAKAIVAQINGGENFADLARSRSQDNATRDNGGDLGWLTPLLLQPFVVDTVTKLKKGAYTTAPVKGSNGWHIILLEDSRPFKLAEYEKLLPELHRNLTRQILVAHLNDLRKQAQAK